VIINQPRKLCRQVFLISLNNLTKLPQLGLGSQRSCSPIFMIIGVSVFLAPLTKGCFWATIFVKAESTVVHHPPPSLAALNAA
jgi:hypothetical protein